MINKQKILDYLSEDYLKRYGTLFYIEDFDDIKIFTFWPTNDDEEYTFDERKLIETLETSLVITSMLESSPTLKIGALVNSDIVLYYKGKTFSEIAENLVKHPHFQELIRRKTGLPIIKESYSQVKAFYNDLNFKEYLENIEYSWMIFNGYDPYERPEFEDE